MSAATDPRPAPDDSVAAATNTTIDNDPENEKPTGTLLERIQSVIQPNAVVGSGSIFSAQAGTSQTSKNSAEPSKQWKRPSSARALAAQANTVATMILNGDLDTETARLYIGTLRGMAQVLSTEVYRSRYLKQAPNLDLTEEP